MNDIYYSPEKHGLTQVAEIEWRDESYEFDLTVLWKHTDGRFFIASDSGCSCPSPFEDYSSVDQLAPILNLGDLLAALDKAEADTYVDTEHTRPKRIAMVSAYQQARSA